MDEVAFDFMDDLAPGCAAMFPQESSVRGPFLAASQIVPPKASTTPPSTLVNVKA